MTKPTAVDRRPGHRSASEGRQASSSVGTGEFAALAESSQLVGRERELELLSNLFGSLGAQGGSLLIRGEAGIGKSALLAEAKRRADQLGMPVVIPPGPTAANQTALNGMSPQPELPRPYWTGLSGRWAVIS
jgi:predicted ATP-dependent serine protease